jgi:hypothetical protein
MISIMESLPLSIQSAYLKKRLLMLRGAEEGEPLQDDFYIKEYDLPHSAYCTFTASLNGHTYTLWYFEYGRISYLKDVLEIVSNTNKTISLSYWPYDNDNIIIKELNPRSNCEAILNKK